jgi:dynein intermediate chain
MHSLSNEEKNKRLESEAIQAFLEKTSRVIERALTSASKFDIMLDYGASVNESHSSREEGTVIKSLKQQFVFRDQQWTSYRAVTDVDVSPFFPELVLVSYTSRDYLEEEEKGLLSTARSSQKQWDTMVSSDKSKTHSATTVLTDLSRTTEGLVMIWSTAVPTRPEFRFTCHSQITSACFHPYNRHLVLGGTYTGQIVVWDTRAKHAPVQKTSLSSGSHTHPIYSMAVVGTKSSYQYGSS